MIRAATVARPTGQAQTRLPDKKIVVVESGTTAPITFATPLQELVHF
jgi:hypothetical protein